MRKFIFLFGLLALVLAGCTTTSSEQQCVSDGNLVCGSDGVTYADACAAQAAGVGIAHAGTCTAAAQEPCTETDSGNDIFTQGSVSKGTSSMEDTCISLTQIKEYYCVGNEVLSQTQNCGAGYICQDGACVAEECVDSDSGVDTEVVGTVTLGQVTKSDVCIDSNQIKEYSCVDGEIAFEVLNCGAGTECIGGRCVESASSCTDSDGGIELFIKGSTRKDGHVYIDYCTGPKEVMEHYCNNGEVESEELSCGVDYFCADGRCIEAQCSETDSGEDEDERGVVSKGGETYEDYCLDDERLKEYYCDGNDVESSIIECDSDEVCDRGKCVSERYCDDSDGGEDEDKEGTVETQDGTFTDYCVNERKVKEYYCDGDEMESSIIVCESDEECDDGECVEIVLPDECYLEPDPGMCMAYIPKYYYDSGAEECMEFIWGGCEGVVPFDSMSECEDACEVD